MNAGAASLRRRGRNPLDAVSSVVRDNTWTLGLLAFLAVLLVFTRFVNPNYDLRSLAGTATSVLVLALAAVAQAVVVISGGIDLSVSAQMALTSCVAATLMKANRASRRLPPSFSRCSCSGCSSARSTEGSWSSRKCPTSS